MPPTILLCFEYWLPRQRVYRDIVLQRYGYTQTGTQTLLCCDTDREENHASNNSSLFPVLVAARTCIPNRYQAMIGGHTDWWEGKDGYTLQTLCLTTIGGLHIQTHRLVEGILEVRRWDEFRCHNIHNKFHKDWFRHSKVNRRGFSDTQAAWKSHNPTFFFFQNKQNRLIRKVG
jgi:hypothetical protein